MILLTIILTHKKGKQEQREGDKRAKVGVMWLPKEEAHIPPYFSCWLASDKLALPYRLDWKLDTEWVWLEPRIYLNGWVFCVQIGVCCLELKGSAGQSIGVIPENIAWLLSVRSFPLLPPHSPCAILPHVYTSEGPRYCRFPTRTRSSLWNCKKRV